MRKVLIFISAFVVSSMAIYMAYYYANVGKLQRGLVAFADELPGTWIGPDTVVPGITNMVTSRSIDNMHPAHSLPPASASLRFDTLYSRAVLERINEEISRKFSQHPPIGFGTLKEGERLFFSYIFRRVDLPQRFAQSPLPIAVGNEKIKALVYQHNVTSRDEGGVRISFRDKGILTLRIPLDNGDEMVIATINPVTDESPVKENTWILLPQIDFNIIKHWTDKDNAAYFLPQAQRYSHIEERIKLKLHIPGDHMADADLKEAIVIKPPFILYLKNRQSPRSYLSLVIRDTELLLKEK